MAAAALPIPDYAPRTAPRVATRPARRPSVRLATQRAHTVAFSRLVLLAGIPVLCLVIYVGFWTSAMRGGYMRNNLQKQIRRLGVENASLQAEVRRLQSPARILQEAGSLGMERPTQIRFVEVPVTRRIANR